MLPINFHRTFIPERRYIRAILDYAALGKKGTYNDIADFTGIPMGKSTGKVPAILDYAKGMGLIEVNIEKSQVRRPVLTSFGITVYCDDKFLGEDMVQWLAHMNLCRGDIGANAWHAVFAKGRLGGSFTKDQLEEYLISIFGSGKERTGPLLVTYTDDAALARAGVLKVQDNTVNRCKAPFSDIYAIPYSAHILTLLETFFQGQSQVTLNDFNKETMWFDICLWNHSEIEFCMSMIESAGYISIDRQMRPWIIEKKAIADKVWPKIWDDMA